MLSQMFDQMFDQMLRQMFQQMIEPTSKFFASLLQWDEGDDESGEEEGWGEDDEELGFDDE